MHCDQINPVSRRLKPIFNFGGADPDIVIMVGTPQRMHAVRAQWHPIGGFSSGTAQRRFKGRHPALYPRLIAHFDEPARHTGIAAHCAAIFFGGLVIFKHGFQNKG